MEQQGLEELFAGDRRLFSGSLKIEKSNEDSARDVGTDKDTYLLLE